jgi:hypothetical protein
MIVAGIDEAGYGPLLGPLVVGCCAFEVECEAAAGGSDGDEPGPYPGTDQAEAGPAPPPCLWKRLRKHVSRNRTRGGRKLHVNDSKVVYSPAGGLRELERSILALLAASGDCPEDLDGLLSRTAAGAVDELAAYPWYEAPPGEPFPIEQEGLSVRLFAKALRAEMQRSATRMVHLAGRIVFERRLNEMFDATRNKSNALWSITASHLDHLLRTFGRQDLWVVCDRQGARGHYGPLLRLMFDEWSLEILRESEDRSDYLLTRGGERPVRLVFCEKAEAQCMPVAVASMLCKYLREALMRRFNAYWHRHLPGVQPTAGYYGDGVRFLQDIDAKRRELGFTDADLVRSR